MIAILLSTYNGEKYIEEQIGSLQAQTYTDWQLYIRDDGSSDNTVRIIKGLSEVDSRIILMPDETYHRGCRESFLWLLERVTAEVFMFCDQDDVWLPNKVDLCLNALKKYSSTIPVLVCTDLRIVDSELKTIHRSMWEANRTSHLIDNPENLIIASLYTGCTMMFNKSAKENIIRNRFTPSILHDQLASLSVFKANGKIIPIHTQTILYRQHSGNAIGLNTHYISFFRKLSKFKKLVGNNLQQLRVSREFLDTSFLKYCILKFKHILKYYK